MIGIKFVAQDKNTKQKTFSTLVFFQKVDEAVVSLIALNLDRILKAMPNSRVMALIINEGECDEKN
jgi:hypothetical protein